MSSKPRILVLQPDKGIAEGIYRALRSMRGLEAEIDVVLSGDVQAPGIRLHQYDLLIVEQRFGEPESAGESEFDPATPVVLVGGPPSGSPRAGSELMRVPLPLSFNLLEESVWAALVDWGGERKESEKPSREGTG